MTILLLSLLYYLILIFSINCKALLQEPSILITPIKLQRDSSWELLRSFIKQAPMEIKYTDLYSKLFIYIHTPPTCIYIHLHYDTHLFQSKLETKPATASLITANTRQEQICCYVVYLVCKQGSEVAHVGKAYRHL